MFKQAKRHFRFESCCRRNEKCNGLHRELVLACDPEFRDLIRSGRNKNAIVFAGDFNYERDLYYHYQHDRKSWKSRSKKRHQWEKHFHTAAEEKNARLADRECEERRANEVYEILKAHSEWVKFDIRNNAKWEYGIDFLLRKKRVERLETEALKSARVWSYPVRTIRCAVFSTQQGNRSNTRTVSDHPETV